MKNNDNQLLNKKAFLNSKLSAYTVVAGALFAGSANTHAQIIYTDVNPDSTTVFFGIYDLDIDNDASADFMFNLGLNSLRATASGSNRIVGTSITNNISNLAYGAAINGTNSFVGSGLMASYFSSFGSTWGPFAGASNAYVGLEFKIGPATHYGWVEVSVSLGVGSFTIHSYAYQSIANDPINAGETDLPVGIENRNLQDITVYGYDNKIHISGTSETATIYDTNGQRVHQSKLAGKTSISLDKGIYLVRVTLPARKAGAEDRSVTKKVYLH
ncbi:MAG: T9SS type A sorting domain-containing protein [Bacteroidetes bacterium]|nr:T9SS type A sorting domain-containing protein [Bacteroidota bacterium]